MFNINKKKKQLMNTSEDRTFYRLGENTYNLCGSVKRLSKQELLINFKWLGDNDLDGKFQLTHKIQASNIKKSIYIFYQETTDSLGNFVYKKIVCFVCGNSIKVCDMGYLFNHLYSLGKNFNRFTRFLRNIGYTINEQANLLSYISNGTEWYSTVVIEGKTYLNRHRVSFINDGKVVTYLGNLYGIEPVEDMLLVDCNHTYEYVSGEETNSISDVYMLDGQYGYMAQLFRSDVEYIIIVRNLDGRVGRIYHTGLAISDVIEDVYIEEQSLIIRYSLGECRVDLLSLKNLADSLGSIAKVETGIEDVVDNNNVDVDIINDIIEYKIKEIKKMVSDIEKVLKG